MQIMFSKNKHPYSSGRAKESWGEIFLGVKEEGSMELSQSM